MKKSITFFGRLILILFVHLFFSITISAQAEPLPCDDPDNGGVGCYCETAGILCTPDDLDGFEFIMSDVANTGDLNGDLCPGLPDGGAPHNVNFFAFIVWCETLTFDVLVHDCSPGTNTGTNNSNFGIQMALFANCPSANGGNWDPVECITNGDETCFDTAEEVPNIQNFTASGLEIGATYYFMVDGCFQSTCKITIDVQGPCGNGEITPWENGIFGSQSVCIGDTETYTAEDVAVGLDGAEKYYYYIDGVLIDEGEEQYTIDINWDAPGSYELCVDVSNLPCISESESPLPNCMTIVVNESGTGDIQADPTTLCSGDSTTITVADANSDPALSNYIIIIGSGGEVVQIVEALATTLTYDQCGVFTAYYYGFVTSDNPPLPMMGDVWTPPDCATNCCSLDEVDITFEDTEDPVFSDAPADITVDCVEDLIADEELTWTDNCAGTGTVLPVVDENYTLCGGGTIDRIWTFSDDCANTTTYTQTIMLDPIPEAVFLSPPADSSINCESAQTFMPFDLSYTNMATGICEISGTVSPTSTGTFDLCGGFVTYTWAFTDACSRTISHSQVVMVQPMLLANFVNPPADITINCDEAQTFTPDTLMYTNGETGSCLIEGTVEPTSDGTLDLCGNSITNTWEFTDVCGRFISHSQVVTVEPIPQASFVNPPGDIIISCDQLETFAPDTLVYTNGGTGNCLIEGTVDPIGDGVLDTCGISVTYTWEFIDDCLRPITHSQTVTVEEDILQSVQPEEDKKEISVFPNPFNNQITIDEVGLRESDIIIYNLIGENLNAMIDISLNSENVVIETTNLQYGVYVLYVNDKVELIFKQ